MIDQNRHVIPSLTQRGQCDRDNVESIEQIFAERPGFNHLADVAAGGGNDPDIHLAVFVSAHRSDGKCLQHAQELGLQPELKVADLVDEECSAVGLLEAPNAAVSRAGERTRTWPNNSLSTSVAGTAAQFTATNGPVLRGLLLCKAWATSSLPVPLSPRISTVLSTGAARWILANTSRIGPACPMIWSSPKLLVQPMPKVFQFLVLASDSTARVASRTSSSGFTGLVRSS